MSVDQFVQDQEVSVIVRGTWGVMSTTSTIWQEIWSKADRVAGYLACYCFQ